MKFEVIENKNNDAAPIDSEEWEYPCLVKSKFDDDIYVAVSSSYLGNDYFERILIAHQSDPLGFYPWHKMTSEKKHYQLFTGAVTLKN